MYRRLYCCLTRMTTASETSLTPNISSNRNSNPNSNCEPQPWPWADVRDDSFLGEDVCGQMFGWKMSGGGVNVQSRKT